jgi:hypothetical protein
MNVCIELYDNEIDYHWWSSGGLYSFHKAQEQIDKYVSKLGPDSTHEYTWKASVGQFIVEGHIVLWNSQNAENSNDIAYKVISQIWYEMTYYVTNLDTQVSLRKLINELIDDYREEKPSVDFSQFQIEMAA